MNRSALLIAKFSAVAAAVVFCLAVLRVPAAETSSAPTVREVAVRGLGEIHVDEGLVKAYTSVKPGMPLNRADIARDIKAILEGGLFSRARAALEPMDDGVRLVYAVSRRPTLVSRVAVNGEKRFRATRIRELLGLEPGDPVDDQILGARVRRVKDAYREDRYADAAMEWSIEVVDETEGLAEVRLEIDEGRRQRVTGLRVSGNTVLPESVVRKAFRRPAWWNPMWFFRKKRYEDFELDAARLYILDAYRDLGYLDAAVSPPDVVSHGEGELAIEVSVDEGQQYRLGDVDVEGIKTFPESEVMRYVRLRRGEVAGASSIRNTAQAIRDYYGSRGYVNTRVEPVLSPRPAEATTDVTFRVLEGELVKIRNIYIRGNTRTRDKVIRRELLVIPGDVFNEVKVRTSERRLTNLGFFESVRSFPETTAIPDERDLVFRVEEKRTGRVMLGAGFSSVDELIGFVELTQGNFDLKGWPYFTGGGQKLKLHGEFGSVRSDYGISFVEPWFLDRKLSLGLDLYRNEFSYTDYDLERTGGAISLTKALPYASRVSFTYRVEDIAVTDINEEDEYVDIVTEDPVTFRREDAMQSSFRVAVTYDTRNSPFIPSRGSKVVTFGNISGGPFGFDTDIYELGIRARHYVPLWFGHVLSLYGRYEVVEGFGDTESVPLSDRLFIGGGRTLRGFDYRDVGPKARLATVEEDTTDYRPYGGNTLAMASLEYTVPVVPGVRLAAFYDIGGVWVDAYEFEADTLASGAGAGIRLDMPGFPIRIDHGWVIEKDYEITEEDAWSIWIGYDY